jgi:hypothetical protein
MAEGIDNRSGDIVEIQLAAWREEKAYLPQLHTDDESGTDCPSPSIGRRDVSRADCWLHSPARRELVFMPR